MHSEHSLINHSLSIYHMPEMNLVLWGNKKTNKTVFAFMDKMNKV